MAFDPVSLAGGGISLLSGMLSGGGVGVADARESMIQQMIGYARQQQDLTQRQGEIRDPSSVYNKGILNLYMKRAQALAPTENTFASGARGTEGMSYSTGTMLGKMMARDAQRKATDAANDSFSQFYIQNQGQANSLLQMSLGLSQNQDQMRQRQFEFNQTTGRDTRDWWSSFGNELITGGSKMFGFGEDSFNVNTDKDSNPYRGWAID